MTTAKNVRRAALIASLSLAVIASQAQASPAALELASGQTPVGSFDPITRFSANGGQTWEAAWVVAPHPRYATLPGTRWVSCGSTVGNGCGLYRTLTYRTGFQLPEGYGAPELLVDLYADNAGKVYLNGVLIGAQDPVDVGAMNYRGTPDTFTAVDASLFRPGLNTIEFDVTDWGVASGLDYQVQIAYDAPVLANIDIHPGSEVNPINLGRQGTTPVAIFSTDAFDAPAEVDAASLHFGATGDEASLQLRGRGVPNCAAEDVDRDGRLDLVCHFVTELAGFGVDDTAGHLHGRTQDGSNLRGADRVTIVPRR